MYRKVRQTMKLNRKDFQMWKDHIYILPSIEVVINDMIYTQKNVSIAFHWLVFHGRLLFMNENT